jgi:hypothetical protein
MTRDSDLAISSAIALLSHYGFELRGYTAQELVYLWLKNYQPHWVRLGVIEALYQGRYKAISVEQILSVWARRGQPTYRFTHEFERLISRKLPQNLTARFDPTLIDQRQEQSLPILTPSSTDLIDEQLDASTDDEQIPAVEEDTQPPVTTVSQDFTEMTVNSEQHPPEVLANDDPSPSYEADWSRCEASKQPIHQFHPPPDSSSFFLKLKAVVQQEEETPTKVVTPGVDEDESRQPQSGFNKN